MKYALTHNNQFVRFISLDVDYRNWSFPEVILPDHLPPNIVEVHEIFCTLCPDGYQPVLSGPLYNQITKQWEQIWTPQIIISRKINRLRINNMSI